MGAFADVAPTLHRFGLNIVPVAGKRAIVSWKHLQALRQTDVELHALVHQHPDADPAVVLGPASGLVDLDVDDPASAEEAIRQRRLPLPPTASFASPCGPHLLYYHAGTLPTRRKLLPGLDFGGQGAIVVVPPAGLRYWLRGLEYIAALPEAWVDLVRDRSRRVVGSAHPSPPDPNLHTERAPLLHSSEYSMLCRSSRLAGP